MINESTTVQDVLKYLGIDRSIDIFDEKFSTIDAQLSVSIYEDETELKNFEITASIHQIGNKTPDVLVFNDEQGVVNMILEGNNVPDGEGGRFFQKFQNLINRSSDH
jgi:hypothetical protein